MICRINAPLAIVIRGGHGESTTSTIAFSLLFAISFVGFVSFVVVCLFRDVLVDFIDDRKPDTTANSSAPLMAAWVF
jgi:hypothetical protein